MTDAAPPRRRLPVLLGLVIAVLGVGGLALVAPRMIGTFLAGTGGLRWSDGESPWTEVTVEQHNRRLWGPVDAFLTPRWTPIAPGLSTARLEFGRGPDPLGVGVIVTRFDPSGWRFRVWGRPDWKPGAVAELAAEAGVPFAVNASYFSDEGPLGLVISEGMRRNAQGTRRAAHFLVIDGRPRIVNAKKAPLSAATEGFQGFPAIMSEGRTFAYMRDGGRGFDVWVADRRTAACLDRANQFLIVVTDARLGGLSLDELATVMGGLGCVDAMAFDGGSSTGMVLRWGDTQLGVGNQTEVPVILGAEPMR